MTQKGGTSQACAACKYQRRRCLPECQLAPYFPADQPKMFQNAHRLFGVSNILKILKHLNPTQRGEAMRSIIYESDMRHKYPVLGCYGIINQLHFEVQVLEEHLHALQLQIEMYKMQQQQHKEQQHQQSQYNANHLVVQDDDDDSPSLLQLGMAPPSNNNNGIIPFGDDIQNDGGFRCNNEQFWGQQAGYGVVMDNNNNLMDRFEMIGGHQQQQYFDVPSQQKEIVHHFEGMHPFLDGGQSSFIDSKVAYESNSSGSDDQSPSLRDRMNAMGHQVEESCVLKNEGTCFGLDL